MGQIWFTSDTHFGHARAAGWRNFNSVETMNTELMKEWNKLIAPKDVVYVIGDFCFSPNTYLDIIPKRLNGRKILIGGNHEHHNMDKYIPYFSRIHGCTFIKVGGVPGILSHMPVHSTLLDGDRAFFNIHGHLHDTHIEDKRYINVNWDITLPLSIEDIEKCLLDQ